MNFFLGLLLGISFMGMGWYVNDLQPVEEVTCPIPASLGEMYQSGFTDGQSRVNWGWERE